MAFWVLRPHYRGRNRRVIRFKWGKDRLRKSHRKPHAGAALPPLDVKIGSRSRPFPTHPCLIAMCWRISHVPANPSSPVRPNNCSLKSPFCVAVHTQTARISYFLPPAALLKCAPPNACYDGSEVDIAKIFSNWWGFSAPNGHCIEGLSSCLISSGSKAAFYKQSLTRRDLSLPLPTGPPPLLCPAASSSRSKGFSAVNERSMGKQAV